MASTEDDVISGRPLALREDDLVKAGRALAAVQDAALDARDRPPIGDRLAAVRGARERKGAAGRDRGGRLALGGGVAALAAAAALALWVRSTEPLAFSIGPEQTRGRVGAWIAATPAGSLPVDFTDGSRIDLAPDARARVVAVSQHGARVVLERGTASVSVIHRAATDWTIVSGPFEVRVVGTRFDAAWDVTEEALTVRLEEGEVAISGACLGAPHRLRRGESVRLSCRDVVAAVTQPTAAEPAPRVSALPTTAPPASSAAPSTTSSTAPPEGAAFPDASSAGGTSATAEPGWRELAGEGRARDAWAAAEREGIDGLLAGLPGADLLQLADLARLAGRGAEARRVYAAIRDRFAGSDAAAAAAFHLGRMSFDGSGAYGEAARWFTTYLGERPGGAFAPEATGRLMEAYDRSGRRPEAQQLAAQYLARWPRGAHAALATSLVAP